MERETQLAKDKVVLQALQHHAVYIANNVLRAHSEEFSMKTGTEIYYYVFKQDNHLEDILHRCQCLVRKCEEAIKYFEKLLGIGEREEEVAAGTSRGRSSFLGGTWRAITTPFRNLGSQNGAHGSSRRASELSTRPESGIQRSLSRVSLSFRRSMPSLNINRTPPSASTSSFSSVTPRRAEHPSQAQGHQATTSYVPTSDDDQNQHS